MLWTLNESSVGPQLWTECRTGSKLKTVDKVFDFVAKTLEQPHQIKIAFIKENWDRIERGESLLSFFPQSFSLQFAIQSYKD
jgi:hypothetical protein